MADNTTLSPGVGGDVVRSEDIGGIKFPVTKIVHGAAGVNGGDVSITNPLPVQISGSDTASLDAFARLRVSPIKTLFDSKHLVDAQPFVYDDQQTSGTGTSSAYVANGACVRMSVGNATAGTRVRQTFKRFKYQPGKSQLAALTFVMGAAATGITRRVGLFDEKNGLYLRQTSAGVAFVVRSFVSGSAVDTVIAQADWNVDKLNGTGSSGKTLDLSKAQILFIDYEWLGVGSIRFGFFVDGLPVVCHRVRNFGALTSVYMSTPNLPVRYEIANDGTGSAASLDHICAMVASEGSEYNTSNRASIQNATTFAALNTTSFYPLLAIRCKSGDAKQASVDIVRAHVVPVTQHVLAWQLVVNPTITGTALSYASVSGATAVEAATAPTSATTVSGGSVIASGIAVPAWNGGNTAGVAGNGGTPITFDDLENVIGSTIAGVSDVVVLAAARLTNTTAWTAAASLSWTEKL